MRKKKGNPSGMDSDEEWMDYIWELRLLITRLEYLRGTPHLVCDLCQTYGLHHNVCVRPCWGCVSRFVGCYDRSRQSFNKMNKWNEYIVNWEYVIDSSNDDDWDTTFVRMGRLLLPTPSSIHLDSANSFWFVDKLVPGMAYLGYIRESPVYWTIFSAEQTWPFCFKTLQHIKIQPGASSVPGKYERNPCTRNGPLACLQPMSSWNASGV